MSPVDRRSEYINELVFLLMRAVGIDKYRLVTNKSSDIVGDKFTVVVDNIEVC
jgi:hypothetical protein